MHLKPVVENEQDNETISTKILIWMKAHPALTDRKKLSDALGDLEKTIANQLGKLWKKRLLHRHTLNGGSKIYWHISHDTADKKHLSKDKWPELTEAEEARAVSKEPIVTARHHVEPEPEPAEAEDLSDEDVEAERRAARPHIIPILTIDVEDFDVTLSSKGVLALFWEGKEQLKFTAKATEHLIRFIRFPMEMREVE